MNVFDWSFFMFKQNINYTYLSKLKFVHMKFSNLRVVGVIFLCRIKLGFECLNIFDKGWGFPFHFCENYIRYNICAKMVKVHLYFWTYFPNLLSNFKTAHL